MPATAATFLVGSAAIVGLPPLNGFVSEWLVFRALLRAGLASSAVRTAVPAAAALGLIGALALACFAKVVGVVFLGVPRGDAAAQARESPRGMRRPMWALAAACAAIGVLPVIAIAPVLRVGALVAGAPAGVADGVGGFLSAPGAAALTGFALALAVGLAVAAAAWTRAARRRGAPRSATWGCGYPVPTARMQYTASSFAAPVLAAYRAVDGVRVVRTPARFATHAFDPVLERLVRPAWHGVRTAAGRLRPLQPGRLSLYLLYVVAAVVTVLLYLILAGRAA
jgi:NADH:ubiquinone oxidoreductase subunit 5 (subunit L)/multisubunit Na+/H+ antiporter MnhA subunit